MPEGYPRGWTKPLVGGGGDLIDETVRRLPMMVLARCQVIGTESGVSVRDSFKPLKTGHNII